jgi:protein-S-isoprenylcysteine O-methyltransferase Ste14
MAASEQRVSKARLLGSIAGTAAFYFLALFIPAGTLRWPAGWIYLAVYFAFVVAGSAWLLRFNPGLLVERMTGLGRRDQKRFDKWLLVVVAVLFTGWMVVMPLDAVRFGWSHVPRWLQGLGVLPLLVSFWLFYLAARHNPYLSPAIRIQTERGHAVVDQGPYRHVRHPMYAGVLPMVVGTALMLGSWLGLVAGLPLVGLVGLRAVLEECVLSRELPGYRDYMTRVRYRLIPHVW